ncbi:hypothetical protein GCM10022243_36410 [Saccharothrix violaceirubra]|uniref:Cobalt-precorrin 5A hydrolase/precorrin-3B C17-methyltransferase n=1 Tax=Saccharothrix violaceirubra TaxID=413306 RepID=A0A7W7SZW7_9PSEU|nr:cobalamin biosynthesis protein [Saccharothrix violaceirubra]MBB4964013.1 cobalt-precorrin 5A hydrolase/precorrin-3B C17-methyltransferase [Saccharothrix violaceirubra]
MIAVFATAARRREAVDLAGFLGPDAVVPDGSVRPALRALWPRLGAAVFLDGAEAAVRFVAPLLRDPAVDPGVVCVDGGFVVALLGRADALARRITEYVDAVPVVTASSAGSALDELVELLDASVDGDLAGCGAALLAGEQVVLRDRLGFPLPALPENVTADGAESAWTVFVTDRVTRSGPRDRTVRLVPRSLVVGIGARADVSTGAVTDALSRLESDRGLDLRAVRAFATLDRKTAERGITEALEDWGFWHDSTTTPLLSYPGEELAVIPVPNPADLAIGIPSVAEAAALRGAVEMSSGGRVEIAAEKVKTETVTIAAARMLPRGRLALVGLGTGDPADFTPRAEAELRRASVVVGDDVCVARVRHLLRPGTRVVADGAVSAAEAGAAVAYVSEGQGPTVSGIVAADVVRAPGVTR